MPERLPADSEQANADARRSNALSAERFPPPSSLPGCAPAIPGRAPSSAPAADAPRSPRGSSCKALPPHRSALSLWRGTWRGTDYAAIRVDLGQKPTQAQGRRVDRGIPIRAPRRPAQFPRLPRLRHPASSGNRRVAGNPVSNALAYSIPYHHSRAVNATTGPEVIPYLESAIVCLKRRSTMSHVHRNYRISSTRRR